MKSIYKLVRQLNTWKRRQSLASRRVNQIKQHIDRVLKSKGKRSD